MNKINLKFTIIVLVLSIILSMFVLYTPRPNTSKDINEFNIVKATEHIEFISREPHSVYDPIAHEKVRLYIKTELEDLIGKDNVEVMNYSEEDLGVETGYDVKNIFGKIPGKSETAILIVGHYDSRGHIGRSGELGASLGAADDGYAVATMLEIARLYANKNLENTIYLLFTDAEETGLLGAKMAVKESAIMDKVSFVMNIEARGVKGPAYMFETSSKNEKVINFYRNADYPVSYSLATAVYSVMPNYTDFTQFTKIGKSGINFAVLDSLYYYHTPHDNYTNISQSSIQHYASQILPLIYEFTGNSKYSDVNYFNGNEDYVFFTILPNVFISYSETFAHILNFIVLGLLLGLIFLLRKELKVKSILKYTGIIFSILVIAAVVSLLFSRFMAFLGKVPFSITYVRMQFTEIPTLLVLVGMIVALSILYKRYILKKDDRDAFVIAGISINTFLAIITGFVLSGASFLFIVPSLIALISLIANKYLKEKWLKHIFLSQNIIWNSLLIVPILYSLFLALTIGGLVALVIILLINLSIVLPMVFKQITL